MKKTKTRNEVSMKTAKWWVVIPNTETISSLKEQKSRKFKFKGTNVLNNSRKSKSSKEFSTIAKKSL